MRALTNMRLAHAPEPMTEAFRKSACVETTVADSAVHEDLDLRCGRPRAEHPDPEPVAKSAAKMHGRAPDPEPCPPGDCMTCCEPFAKDKLVGCKTAHCTYVQ